MRTIYVLLASKQYDSAPKVLRAFHTEAEAIAVKEMIDACNPTRPVEVVATRLDGQAEARPLAPPTHGFPAGVPFVALSNAETTAA